jgi:hypothetical protein
MAALIPSLAALALAAAGGEAAQAHRPSAAMAALADELHRHWALECHEKHRDLKFRVVFTLKEDGRLAGRPDAGKAERSRDPAVRSAAWRAIQSVYNAAPFRDLPPELYGRPITVRFNAAEACS